MKRKSLLVFTVESILCVKRWAGGRYHGRCLLSQAHICVTDIMAHWCVRVNSSMRRTTRCAASITGPSSEATNSESRSANRQCCWVGCVRFEMPAGRGRKARSVKYEVRIKQVTVNDGVNGELEVTCTVAYGIGTFACVKPVILRLLTNQQVPHCCRLANSSTATLCMPSRWGLACV